MRTPTFDELVRLSEEAAVQRYFDGRNYVVLRRLLGLFVPVAAIGLLAAIAGGALRPALAWGAGLAVALAVMLLRTTGFFARNARVFALTVPLLLLLGVSVALRQVEVDLLLVGGILPVILLLLRLRPREALTLAAISVGTVALLALRQSDGLGLPAWAAIGAAALWSSIALWAETSLTRHHRHRFLREWHPEVERRRQQARMQSELDDARTIQLSMLPQGSPELPWLDLSAASLPATEVGGDYFDYLQPDPERLVVVIGDVAGHGVASGLVLASVRSGLYLLQDRIDEPTLVLAKLDEMLRDTSPRRMFVTLQIAVLDHRRQSLTVASAGHPPLLHLEAASGVVHPRGGEAPPLGTRLDPRYAEQRYPLAAGDLLLFHTDGVLETPSFHGQPFGRRRLQAELKRAGDSGGARDVRDTLLSRLAFYKADAEQIDDVTLVVARYRG